MADTSFPDLPNPKSRMLAVKTMGKGFNKIFEKILHFLSGESAIGEYETLAMSPHLPTDMVAGSVPYVAGAEMDAVWHAASQACGTENIHYCYSVDGGRVWYLAVASASLGSIVNSWCPLASALPGQSEYWDKDTVYLYEQEGQASALRWDKDSGRMQLFLGPSRTILPRIQSMNTNFVTINPDTARPLAWQNRNLRLERMSRNVSIVALLSGMSIAAILIFYILSVNIATLSLRPELLDIKAQTKDATEKLVTDSYHAFSTNMPKHFVRARELHQVLFDVGGQLLRYQLTEAGTVEWEALVPQAVVAAENPALRSSKPTAEIGIDGRVRIIGTE